MSKIKVKSSKPIAEIKKGDKIKVDSLNLEVDAHVVMIEHSKTTKEMAIEIFDKKTDKDYQIRYFSDNAEESIQFYELKEIVYNPVEVKKIEW
jgi:ribosomal 50S subunit-recycling heat shock protein